MRPILTTLLVLAVTVIAHAHFVFVTPESGGSTARVFISENLTPDLDVKVISGTKVFFVASDGSSTPLTLSQPEPTFFTATIRGEGIRVFHGLTDFGVVQRGQAKPHRLVYYPKAILGDPLDARSKLGERVPVEIIPEGKPGAIKLKLIANGKPVADGEITILLPDGSEKRSRTDANGLSEAVLTENGRYGAWARYWEAKPGEVDGKPYAELRHYATLVFDAGTSEPHRDSAAISASDAAVIAALPEATSSFGAAVSDGWLYVYGGHISPTHTYFKEAVSGRFHRARLAGEVRWESLPGGPGLQGMNLAAHGGKVYRVGGMEPRNEKGKAADSHSVADVSRFDPKSGKWESIGPLPEARSSHDVVFVGDTMMVAGGWNMTGKTQTWSNTLAMLDVAAPNPKWTEIPQPFRRRALMCAAYAGKLYVVGGINEDGKIVRSVAIYDPASSSWSEGPELPEGVLGFSPAVGVHQDRIYVAVADGTVFRLNASGSAWEQVSHVQPRVAHRLVSDGSRVLVLGGAAKGKNLDLVESLEVAR